VLDGDVLVLSRVYLPMRLTSVRVAVTLLFQGRAQAILPDYSTHDFHSWTRLPVRAGEDAVGTVTGRLKVPRVIVLRHYEGVPRYEVRFTRSNVYARDGHACQYCGVAPGLEQLTLDHVVPLSRGGGSGWENVVTCCVRCNRRKADRTPDSAGLHLRRPPRKPRWHPLTAASRRRPHPEEWRHFVDESILAWSPPRETEAAS
jgi:5-methylcytosine-specific restriction endonuclease McrA